MTEFVESIVSLHTLSASTAFRIILISWIPRLEVGQGRSQGQRQVKKVHHIQKSLSGHVIHVLRPILAIEFDGHVGLVVWGHFQKFSAKVRSRSGKKVKFSNLKMWIKNCLSWPVFTQEFNGAICVYVLPQKLQKSHLKKWRHKLVWFRRQKTVHLGVENWAIDFKFCTIVDD